MVFKDKKRVQGLAEFNPVCLNAGLMKPWKGSTRSWAKEKTGGGKGMREDVFTISPGFDRPRCSFGFDLFPREARWPGHRQDNPGEIVRRTDRIRRESALI